MYVLRNILHPSFVGIFDVVGSRHFLQCLGYALMRPRLNVSKNNVVWLGVAAAGSRLGDIRAANERRESDRQDHAPHVVAVAMRPLPSDACRRNWEGMSSNVESSSFRQLSWVKLLTEGCGSPIANIKTKTGFSFSLL